MANAWEGQVGARHEGFFIGYAFEDVTPQGDGFFLVGVKLNGNARIGKLDRMGMQHVARDDELLALRFNDVNSVSWGVAGGIDGGDAGDDFTRAIACQGLPLATGLIGGSAGLRHLEEALHGGRRFGGNLFG